MRPAERFTWGRIVAEYEIGPYHIVAYHPTLGRHPEGLSVIARALKLPEEM